MTIIKLLNKYQKIKFCISINIISHISFNVFKLISQKIHVTIYALISHYVFELIKKQILDKYKKLADGYYYYYSHSMKLKIY